MSNEFFLPGLNLDPPSSNEGVYLGIFPRAVDVHRFSNLEIELRREHGLTGNPRPSDHRHVTLGWLGPSAMVSEKIIQSFGHACEAAVDLTSPFEIEFDRALSFGGGAFVLNKPAGNEALFEFHHRLLSEMVKQRSRFHRESPKLNPHMTLLYERKRIPQHSIEPINWMVGELALIRSHVGETKYDWLGRWEFRG